MCHLVELKFFTKYNGSKLSLGSGGGREKPTFIFIHGGVGVFGSYPLCAILVAFF